MKTTKYIVFILIASLFTIATFAQGVTGHYANPGQVQQISKTITPSQEQITSVPNTMNYQAVARNSSGAILANQAVGLRLSIEDGAGGTILYSERQVPTTNQFGLLTVKLGAGTVLSGTWAGINWSNGNQWLKVDMDPTGGNSYTAMGESEMLSVPFSNYSLSTAAVSGTINYVSKFTGNGTIGNSRIIDDGTYMRFNNATGTQYFDFGAPNYCDITIQNTGTGEDLFFANRESTADISGLGLGTASAFKWLVGSYNDENFGVFNWGVSTTNAALTVLGSNSNVGIGNTTPSYKLHVSEPNAGARAIYGENTYNGVMDGIGVYGYSHNQTNYGYGVYGDGGYVGVEGVTNGGADAGWEYGVYGISTGTAGTRYGVYGSATGATANYGVYGYATGGITNYAGYFNGQAHISKTSSLSDATAYSASHLQLEAGSTTNWWANLMFLSDTYGGFGLFGNPNGLLVLDTAGSNYLAVYASAFNVISDKTLKKDINNVGVNAYETYLSQIRNINAITYLYNDENPSSSDVNSGKSRVAPHVGFTAQSLPASVQTSIPTSGKVIAENKLGYNLSDMVGLNTIGIKALDNKQTQSDKEIADLKSLVKHLEAEIQQLKNK